MPMKGADHQGERPVFKIQRCGSVTLECKKWRQMSFTVFVNPLDASLGRDFTFDPASYRLPFPRKQGHRKWIQSKLQSKIQNPKFC